MEEIFSRNFIEEAIDKDLEEKVYDHVQTRFPPEPNGYLHIGHAKAISIDFGMAEKYNGKCNLRLDDTNPTKEDTEYVDAIMEDIKWLGFKWDKVLYASDYFDDIYAAAVKLIKKGKAYVDDLSPEEIREYRGTLKTPGKNSPYRERTIEEKGCKVCEKDYLTVFPKLAVMYYAAMKHIKVQTDTDKITELIIEHGLISFHSFNQIQESIYFFL